MSRGPHNYDSQICTQRSFRFFQRSPTSNTIQITSNQKNMAIHQPPQLTPHQQTFLNIANRSFNIQPYPWQYGMGGFAIERILKQEELITSFLSLFETYLYPLINHNLTQMLIAMTTLIHILLTHILIQTEICKRQSPPPRKLPCSLDES